MPKNNAFLSMVKYEVQKQVAATRPILIQMCLDSAMIAANNVFQMGPGRCRAFCDAFNAAMNELSLMTVEDGKTDRELWHTKAKLDERLKEICGEHFQPWEERYK